MIHTINPVIGIIVNDIFLVIKCFVENSLSHFENNLIIKKNIISND